VPVIGTDENGTIDIADCDLTKPVLIVIGNETTGLSTAWHASCDVMARIPISGSATSLNAANAGTIALYEAARQRRTDRRGEALRQDALLASAGEDGDDGVR
jgi:TrmH family RNA methyltransferase